MVTHLTAFGVACEASIPSPLFSNGAKPLTNAVLDGKVPKAESCGKCHEEIYQEWSNSRHAVSHNNPNFSASVAEAPLAKWCLNCHLPIRSRGLEASNGPPRGVTCAVCHIRDNKLLVSKPLSKWGQSEHPNAEVNPTLSDASFCAGCHQFEGPTSTHPIVFKGDPVQDTWGEWSRVPEPKSSCQQCHMPTGRHTFYGGHHLKTVQSALEVTVSEGELTVATTEKVSHAVPTGDPFRRMVLRFCGTSCDESIKTHTFGIVHTYEEGIMRISRDTRLKPQSSKTLPIPPGASSWELRYFYADPRLAEQLPEHEVSLVIAHATLPE